MKKIISIMYLSKRDLMQNGKDFELARDLLKAAAVSSRKLILRNAETTLDSSTELLNEIATTDMAIGDVTTEIMATTLGKIPHEMFYMEDTTHTVKYASQTTYETTTVSLNSTSLPSKSDSGLSTSSVVLCILLTALLIILLLCCITACLIARTRRKRQFYEKHGMECEPGCGGISQPLLGMEKTSNVTSKSSSQRY